MARRKAKSEDTGSFTRSLSWAVGLGLVFSAGLITGQRLLKSQDDAPLVSISAPAATAAGAKPEKPRERLKRSFSFYDHLTKLPTVDGADAPARGDEPAAREEPAPKPAAEPAPKPAAEEPPQAPAKAPVSAPQQQAAVDKPAPAPSPAAAVQPAAPSEPQVAQRGPSFDAPPGADRAVAATTPAQILDKVADVLTADEPARAQPARYTLQVSSYPDREAAEGEVGRLRGQGVDPHLVVVDVPGQGKLYRVRVGKFHSVDEARTAQSGLRSGAGVSAMVTPL